MECCGEVTITESGTEAMLLLGSPNVGKSALFQALTQSRVTISNYPGTTIALARGSLNGKGPTIYDTPGIYGLVPITEDEVITRDALAKSKNGNLILVLDAKNLRRGLAMALELAEVGRPFVIALNMGDEAQALGMKIDHRILAERIGVPVIPTVAIQRLGVDNLIRALDEARVSHLASDYPEPLKSAIASVEELLPQNLPERRLLVISLLCGNEEAAAAFGVRLTEEDREKIAQIREAAAASLDLPLRAAIVRHRLSRADALLEGAVSSGPMKFGAHWSDRIGEWATHPVAGTFILLGVLVALYKFVGEFGAGTLVDMLESDFFEGILNPILTKWIEVALPVPFLRDLLVGQYGLITMGLTYALAIILPIVGTFFLAFSVLEDSGYLPRLSLLANRFFRILGLNGKAVLPMVLGLGCDTMATLTTRILETRKERVLVTLLLALGVPCSAQLGVILGMLGESSSVLAWAGVVTGVLLLVGIIAARLLPGESSDFLVELPPMRFPQLSNVLVKTLARLEWYLREAVPLFLIGTLLLFILDRVGALAQLQVFAAPLVERFLGLPRESTEFFLVGFLRRDYGAAGLFALAKAGTLDPQQVLVSLVTITLFMPCVANLMIIVKEHSIQMAIGMSAFIFPFAFLVGGALRWALYFLG